MSTKTDILNVDPEAWTPEEIAKAGEILRPTIQRLRKARGDLAQADQDAKKVKAEKKAKKKPTNIDLDKPL
jgi:hypothetical protein